MKGVLFRNSLEFKEFFFFFFGREEGAGGQNVRKGVFGTLFGSFWEIL